MTESVRDSVTESVSSLRLRQSLFIVKLQALSLNMKPLLLMTVMESLPESVFGNASDTLEMSVT